MAKSKETNSDGIDNKAFASRARRVVASLAATGAFLAPTSPATAAESKAGIEADATDKDTEVPPYIATLEELRAIDKPTTWGVLEAYFRQNGSETPNGDAQAMLNELIENGGFSGATYTLEGEDPRERQLMIDMSGTDPKLYEDLDDTGVVSPGTPHFKVFLSDVANSRIADNELISGEERDNDVTPSTQPTYNEGPVTTVPRLPEQPDPANQSEEVIVDSSAPAPATTIPLPTTTVAAHANKDPQK